MKTTYFYFLMLSLAVTACRKLPDTSPLTTGFVVQTSKDAHASFGSYKTYSISDTISLRTTDPNDTIWSDADSKRLVDEVKSNMAERGYTLVDHNQTPDLGIALTAIKDLNIGVIYPGWWWGGYWGCYWYYCGYPPYYGYGAVYSVPTGTVILDMIDLKNADANGELDILWSSVLSGGLGYTSDDVQLGVNAIDQAYEQSPYIKTN